MKKLILATHNKHKADEIKAVLKGHKILTLSDIGYTDEIPETGSTFTENALIKARTISKKYKILTLADDSGLEVAYLKGEPGVYSARYAGKNATQKMLCKKILSKLETLKKPIERNACFKTVMALVYSSTGEEVTFEGKLNGWITAEMKGNNGFGYDPIFFYPQMNKTLAELTAKEKNSISHRSKSLKKVATYLNK